MSQLIASATQPEQLWHLDFHTEIVCFPPLGTIPALALVVDEHSPFTGVLTFALAITAT
jgi:hypothetical protein